MLVLSAAAILEAILDEVDGVAGHGRCVELKNEAAAREVHTNLFFKFVVAKSYAAIDSSATYPVKSGLIDAMALDRVP